jgi:hypothetical protein
MRFTALYDQTSRLCAAYILGLPIVLVSGATMAELESKIRLAIANYLGTSATFDIDLVHEEVYYRAGRPGEPDWDQLFAMPDEDEIMRAMAASAA